MIKPLKSGLLTRDFLTGLEAGPYLVSNIRDFQNKPIYADYVAPVSERESQWESIVKVSAHQRLCYVFKDKEGYETFQSKEEQLKLPL